MHVYNGSCPCGILAPYSEVFSYLAVEESPSSEQAALDKVDLSLKRRLNGTKMLMELKFLVLYHLSL